jgi:hypothetical protein
MRPVNEFILGAGHRLIERGLIALTPADLVSTAT